jgi:hypothetical protein
MIQLCDFPYDLCYDYIFIFCSNCTLMEQVMIECAGRIMNHIMPTNRIIDSTW